MGIYDAEPDENQRSLAEAPSLIGSRPRLLLVSMYPLDQGRWGPTVRIMSLRDELRRLVDLDLVAGYRPARRRALARYAFSGRLRGLDGIYVESSTFLPAETDIAFLGLARTLRIPVVTYVRDAYQLFDDYGTARTLRGRIATAAFGPMISALRAVSSRVAVPSRGLASALGLEDAVLLPPGSPAPADVALSPGANRVLFVGDARLPAHGADRLITAVSRARYKGIAVELELVCRPGQEPPGPLPAWTHLVRAEGTEIAERLPGIVATAIPRPRGPYNDLALPVKLYEYLAYGRPLLVTDCTEQARVVASAGAGVVTADDPPAMAEGIARILGAPADQVREWAANATAAARASSWQERARQIVQLLLGAP